MRGPPGVLPVPRVDPAGGAASVVYVVDLAVEVTRLLPALRQGQLRPGHLPESGPRSPMQLPAAAGAPGSAAPAGCTGPGRPPRHHDQGGGWRPRTGGLNGGRPGWCRCPCGPAAPARRRPLLPPSASHAAMCARSSAVRARVRARPAGQSEPSAAAAGPPPRCRALRPPRSCRLFLPAAERSPSPFRRSALPPFATSASARCGSGGAGNRAAPETGGGAPGAQVPSPRPELRGRVLGHKTRPLVGQSDPLGAPVRGKGDETAPYLCPGHGLEPLEVRARPALPLLPNAPSSLHPEYPSFWHRWPQILKLPDSLSRRIRSQARSG